jgi:PII-like signaling protein
MNIDRIQRQNYLKDHNKKPISLGRVSFTEELEAKGYDFLNLNRISTVYIPTSVVPEWFEPIENFERLWLKKDVFFSFYPWWYSPKLDCYLRVSEVKNRKGLAVECYEALGVFYTHKNLATIKDFLNQNRVLENNTSNTIEIVSVNIRGQLEFQAHELRPAEIDIETMYNDDFKPVYRHVIEKLNQDAKGVVLFHGLAGSGKTHLIKHLTTMVNKRFIFLPVHMIDQLTNPAFMPMLMSRANSILVLEDCENYIEDRNLGRAGSVVSSLLQITDGILSDLLNLQVICTFNTDLTKVDAALLREGRLIAEYEFMELEQEKWNSLMQKRKVTGKRTLANAFNSLTLKSDKPEKRVIGF